MPYGWTGRKLSPEEGKLLVLTRRGSHKNKEIYDFPVKNFDCNLSITGFSKDFCYTTFKLIVVPLSVKNGKIYNPVKNQVIDKDKLHKRNDICTMEKGNITVAVNI